MFLNEEVVSKEESYILGFLYADGCISGKKNEKYYTIKIVQKESEKEFIQSIADWFNINLKKDYKLKYIKKTNSYMLNICDVQLVSRLINLGITPRKSYDESSFVFDNIPLEYKKDFILGLWDGDGTFAKSKGDRNRNICGLISNNQLLLESILNFINQSIGEDFLKSIKYRTKGDRYPRIRFFDNKAKIFGDWLYDDKVYLYMKSKYEKFLNFNEIRERFHVGANNTNSIPIFCENSNKYYSCAREACESEFGVNNITKINYINRVSKFCGLAYGIKFKRITKEEYLNGISAFQMDEIRKY